MEKCFFGGKKAPAGMPNRKKCFFGGKKAPAGMPNTKDCFFGGKKPLRACCLEKRLYCLFIYYKHRKVYF